MVSKSASPATIPYWGLLFLVGTEVPFPTSLENFRVFLGRHPLGGTLTGRKETLSLKVT